MGDDFYVMIVKEFYFVFIGFLSVRGCHRDPIHAESPERL